MEELGLDVIPAVSGKQRSVPFRASGTPVTATEVEKRLSANLYRQLADDDPDFVPDAISRAEVYVGTVLSWLGVRFDLDNATVREIVLMQTVYELHMALGHEEAGREYRKQMHDTIVAAYGSFPTSDGQTEVKVPAASVSRPEPSRRHGRLIQARRFSE
jgi:hypothetical protein